MVNGRLLRIRRKTVVAVVHVLRTVPEYLEPASHLGVVTLLVESLAPALVQGSYGFVRLEVLVRRGLGIIYGSFVNVGGVKHAQRSNRSAIWFVASTKNL